MLNGCEMAFWRIWEVSLQGWLMNPTTSAVEPFARTDFQTRFHTTVHTDGYNFTPNCSGQGVTHFFLMVLFGRAGVVRFLSG